MENHLPKSSIRAAAFDMDGLIFNSEDVYFETGRRLFRLFGQEYTQELSDRLMGCTPRDFFQTVIDLFDLGMEWTELQKTSNQIFLEIMPEKLQPMPGLLELLDYLDSRKMPRAICTSSSTELVEKMLGIHQLQPRFDFIITSECVTNGKPHPEIYLKAAERFGIAPHEMLILEDSHNGCKAGANAGGFVAAVPGTHSMNHDFSMASCRLNSLDDPFIFQALEH